MQAAAKGDSEKKVEAEGGSEIKKAESDDEMQMAAAGDSNLQAKN